MTQPATAIHPTLARIASLVRRGHLRVVRPEPEPEPVVPGVRYIGPVVEDPHIRKRLISALADLGT